jgi:hypothetical protein
MPVKVYPAYATMSNKGASPLPNERSIIFSNATYINQPSNTIVFFYSLYLKLNFIKNSQYNLIDLFDPWMIWIIDKKKFDDKIKINKTKRKNISQSDSLIKTTFQIKPCRSLYNLTIM